MLGGRRRKCCPGGTALTWNEQGTYLDGFGSADAPKLRREGTTEVPEGLARHLAKDAPQAPTERL